MNSKNIYKITLFGCAVLLLSFLSVSYSASQHEVNAGPDGIAIKGYDPVAYFTMGKPVKGSDQFTYEWKGAKWQFSSREHLDLFSADPDKYAPQYGGY
jgi:YHS domain-containing protein